MTPTPTPNTKKRSSDGGAERPPNNNSHNSGLIARYPNNLYVQYIYAPTSRHPILTILSIFAFWYLSYKVCMLLSDAAVAQTCERKASNIMYGVEALLVIQAVYIVYLKEK
ncbi:hypothetical protein BDW74DRAFT_183558 [Aspergillus multicolor]|uniref:uncharacterized protein n=1 Tax=Aspergillus multicolor TaxID=41759 RepID=UPI003CCC9328